MPAAVHQTRLKRRVGVGASQGWRRSPRWCLTWWLNLSVRSCCETNVCSIPASQLLCSIRYYLSVCVCSYDLQWGHMFAKNEGSHQQLDWWFAVLDRLSAAGEKSVWTLLQTRINLDFDANETLQKNPTDALKCLLILSELSSPSWTWCSWSKINSTPGRQNSTKTLYNKKEGKVVLVNSRLLSLIPWLNALGQC